MALLKPLSPLVFHLCELAYPEVAWGRPRVAYEFLFACFLTDRSVPD